MTLTDNGGIDCAGVPWAKLLRGLLNVTWVAGMLAWPFAQRIVAADVFIQFVRWKWNGAEALGWNFALHFAGLVALTCFFSMYRPKK